MSFLSVNLIRKCYYMPQWAFGVRFYARGRAKTLSRTPVNVKFPFEAAGMSEETIIELDEKLLKGDRSSKQYDMKADDKMKLEKPTKTNQQNYEKRTPKKYGEKKLDVKKIPDSFRERKIEHKEIKLVQPATKNDVVFDEQGEVIYEKLKDNSSIVSSILTNVKSKNIRTKAKQVLIENWRLIAEGLVQGYKMDALFFSRKEDLAKLRAFLPPTGTKIFKIPYKEIQLWSTLETSPGTMGIFRVPDLTRLNSGNTDNCIPLDIVCDNIRDPGNLGSILRIASAVGCQKLLLTKGCVDLWDPKVIRSASGAHFHLNVQTNFEWSNCHDFIKEDTLFCIADNKLSMQNIKSNQSLSKSPEHMSYEARKPIKESLLHHNKEDMNNTTKPSISKDEVVHVPITTYYEMDFTSTGNVTLVVGGETEGLSEDCFLFADKLKGVRLNIPMQAGSESLNAGAAMAVIAFEIRKQFLSKIHNTDLSTSFVY